MKSLSEVKKFVSNLSNKQLEELTKKLKKKKRQFGPHFGPATAEVVAPQSSVLERVVPVKQTERERFAVFAKELKIPMSERGALPLGKLGKIDPRAAAAFKSGKSFEEYFEDRGETGIDAIFRRVPKSKATPEVKATALRTIKEVARKERVKQVKLAKSEVKAKAIRTVKEAARKERVKQAKAEDGAKGEAKAEAKAEAKPLTRGQKAAETRARNKAKKAETEAEADAKADAEYLAKMDEAIQAIEASPVNAIVPHTPVTAIVPYIPKVASGYSHSIIRKRKAKRQ